MSAKELLSPEANKMLNHAMYFVLLSKSPWKMRLTWGKLVGLSMVSLNGMRPIDSCSQITQALLKIPPSLSIQDVRASILLKLMALEYMLLVNMLRSTFMNKAPGTVSCPEQRLTSLLLA